MDDVLGGCHDDGELYETYGQLKSAFNSANMNLRKWCSNSGALLEQIPAADKEQKALTTNVKTLGISWSQTNDVFTFDIAIPVDTIPRTKRQLASEIASLFDPLGWICPVIISAKNILQSLWAERLGWDDEIPIKYTNLWLKIKSELHELTALQIPRWVNYSPNEPIEFHGFCDAAEPGYSASIYIKNIRANTVHLLVAKARVSPIKKSSNNDNVTIPRLELSGALLLAQLTEKVLSSIPCKFNRICLWTDSRIVLDWLHADSKKYKSFIASRVEKINKLTQLPWWSHVRSADNAADCASRGLLPSELAKFSLW